MLGGPLLWRIDNLLSMRLMLGGDSEGLEKLAHLLAKVEVMVVERTLILGRTTCCPSSGQHGLEHLVPENPDRNHGLQPLGGRLVTTGFPLAVEQPLATAPQGPLFPARSRKKRGPLDP
jgi:hypothetical protein